MAAASLPIDPLRLMRSLSARQGAVSAGRRSPLSFEQHDAIFRALCAEVHMKPIDVIGDPTKMDCRGRHDSDDKGTFPRAMIVAGMRAIGCSYPQIAELMHRHHTSLIHIEQKRLWPRMAHPNAYDLLVEVRRLELLARSMAAGMANADTLVALPATIGASDGLAGMEDGK